MIYLDHNATTPLAPEVRAAMAAALSEIWGNPSSAHALGRQARDAVERARGAVAALLGASPEEIVFTSGGTEGDALAVRGLARAASAGRPGRPRHLVSSRLEHPAVLGALEQLAGEGFEVGFVALGPRGEIAPEALRAALREETVLVTLAAANHELGNIHPVAELVAVAHAAGALFHTDAVQAAGRIAFDVAAARVDAATISAHKLHGPKGIGAVFVRRGLALAPTLAGGHQERDRRAGTENVAGIVGFGEACRLAAAASRTEEGARVAALRDRLEAHLLAIPGARLHGDSAGRVPGTTLIGFDGADGQLVAIGLDLEGICVSTGAACTSGTVAPSAALLALGMPRERAAEAVRFSLGRDNTADEIDRAAAAVAAVVARVRRAAA